MTLDKIKIAEFINELRYRYKEHSIAAYSAQMSFFMILAIFPFMIFLINVLGRLSMDLGIVVTALEIFFPVEVHGLILGMVDQYILSADSTSVISFSVIGTLWSASKGVRGIMRSINRAYGLKETRGFIVVKILDIMYTLLIVIVIILLLALPNIGKGFFTYISRFIYISDGFSDTFYGVKQILIPTMTVLIISSIYIYVPDVKLKMKDVIWGSMFAIAGWGVLSLTFSIFVTSFVNYSVVYGSLTAVVILMLWFYASGIVLILGGEINSVLNEKSKRYS